MGRVLIVACGLSYPTAFSEGDMNVYKVALVAAVAGLASGCANLERSRDTANHDVSGQTLAQQVCSNCHGITGNSRSPEFPNLAAQQQDYIVAQLQGFKAHSREDPPGPEYMWGLSHNLTDKQITELATYFSEQKLAREPRESNPERIEAGRAIFIGGIPDKGVPACATCHGPQGLGNATIPRIAGQHVRYLIRQLTVFQHTNERPAGTAMKAVAHNLSRENMEIVAACVQALTNR
ncbi:MAG: c-type cytochrome [Rudaea sp.]